MSSDRHARKPVIVALIVSALVLLLALGASFAVANKPADQAAQGAVVDSPTVWGDDGILEVGVEWINDFPGTADDRSAWDDSCDGLYNRLVNEGWTSRFRWTDWNAWETDFKNESLGGSEDAYADNVDIAMLCTHGSNAYDNLWEKTLSSVYFGSSHADQDLSPGDAYMAYGDSDLEWLAFDSCSVLSDGTAAPYFNRGYWAATMNKLHLLLGFKNTMYVWQPGDGLLWGYYMNGLYWDWFGWVLPPSTVQQAWFSAVDYVQPGVTCARVLANKQENFNDYLWGKGPVTADPSPDGYYWYLDHCSTGPATKVAEKSNNQPEVLAMPVIEVQERYVDPYYVLGRIAPAFDLTGNVITGTTFYFMTDNLGGMTRTLQVDRITGSFYYRNLSKLWTVPEVPPTIPPADQAFTFMEEWFKMNGEALPGVWYRDFAGWDYNIEEIVGMEQHPTGNGDIQEQEIGTTPIDGVLSYPRLIPAKSLTANGIEVVNYPVYGPGGRLKFYLGGAGDIIGAIGGTRDVLVTAQMVQTLDAREVWDRFLKDPSIAIPEVDWLADTIAPISYTLGYYEMPYLQDMKQLIPVWGYLANLLVDGKVVAENVEVYLPAAEEYMPPEAAILDPSDGALFMADTPISFEGGVNGGTPPYTYKWSSSGDGYLGNTMNIVSPLSSPLKNGTLFTQIVSLEVTDANGQMDTATISLKIISPYIWMPITIK